MGRLRKGETPKVWKNVTVEEKAQELLGLAGTALSEKLGFRPTTSQVIFYLIKHYERTEGK